MTYANRIFVPCSNSENGEVDSSTIFYYHQHEDIVWGTYAGGDVRFGTLIATVGDEGVLDMRYQHVNVRGELMTGICRSVPELLPDGRLRLHESWEWTSGDRSRGESILEEQQQFPAANNQP